MVNKDALLPYLIFNKPVLYNDITIYPITMENVLSFQIFSQSILLRKDSTFNNKQIIKMSYLDFLFYSFNNFALEEECKINELSKYLLYAIGLLQLCCKEQEVRIDAQSHAIAIGNTIVTPQIFDDLRRIIIIQNDINFDIDEFLNYDTEQALLKAQKHMDKNKDKANIEDYIDSLVIAMNTTEDRIMNMTIRKFWRYVKRYQLHENYTIAKTGECTGMVSFKEPIKYWMVSLDEQDKYEHLKTDENDLKSKIQ